MPAIPHNEEVVRQANKRGLARLAAVQALYQMDLSEGRLADIVEEYENLRIGQIVDDEHYLDADLGWFRGVVSGVVRHQADIDPLIHDALPADWPLARIDTLMRSVLRSGVFELMKRNDVPAKVVITEYLEIAKAFFDGEEPKLINGVLDHIARGQREGEFSDSKAG
ncbi:MAG: transcription antitermination factor NusB [Rhizobiaceae bacterium]|jgi:N utilization substance protein B|nr:transcription antitermination factor NusB [Rhizobiaceae bacterium]